MLVTYRNQLAVIGGFHSRDNDLLAVTSLRMLLLDNNTGQWVDGPALRHPRAVGGRKFSAGDAGAAVIDGRLIIVGGEAPTSVSGAVQAYDLTASTATWTTLPSLDATASESPPSATPSTPSEAPPNPGIPHPPTSSKHSPSRNGAPLPWRRSWTRRTASRRRVGDPAGTVLAEPEECTGSEVTTVR
jgi:Kelch motif